ncbi:hypothetical protein MKQ68_16420 [Chitinophaga horti]|uniref:Uncharacterized protein n=1 Tax=Chitinophaga horti TaxID=2920382 RepID=A0ABY6IWK7_9BACT|nr:hypothetical protein [Chitinophaga horti]UYQ91675.1 hypothetical protein MKQ68_16420 [Chitinophaga horti]
MKYTFRIASVALVGLLSLSYSSTKAQLKIGGNPNTIDPKALLELESQTKGMLLPRINDLTTIGTTGIANGMIIYLNDATNPGLYIYNNGWKRLAGADAIEESFWKFGGNNTGSDQSIGSNTNFNISLRTNGAERFTITNTGQINIAEAPTTGAATDLSVLLRNLNGDLVQRTISDAAFGPVVTSIGDGTNTVNGNIGFQANVAVGHANLSVAADNTAKTLTLNAPLLSAASVGTYGLLSKADYTTLFATDRITLADAATADATSDQKGASLTYDATTGKYELKLAHADNSLPGIVSATNQTFRGDKVFTNGVEVGQNLNVTLNGEFGGTLTAYGNISLGAGGGSATTSNFNGNIRMPDLPTATPPVDATDYQLVYQDGGDLKQLTINGAALSAGVASMNGEKGALSIGFAAYPLTGVASPAVTVDAVAKTINLQIPEANSTTVTRGLVSNADQVFAGNKSFESGVSVGSALVPTSTLSVEGSMSAAIKQVLTTTYTLTASDYTIIAKVNGASTFTLPTAASSKGRIYNIKKVPAVDGVYDDYEITINVAGAGTIEAGATTSLSVAYSSLTVQSDGTQWYILRRN